MTNKDKLFTRTYSWEDEEIVVVGNRSHIADTVPEVIECEFVFRNDELITAHVLRFKQELIDAEVSPYKVVSPYSVEPPQGENNG